MNDKNTKGIVSLPHIGDLWDLGRNGLSVCTGINDTKKEITWYSQDRAIWFTQSFHSFRKFVRKMWAINP